MTTSVTIHTHDKAANVKQIAPAAFNGEHELATRQAVPVIVPADSEMTFYVHEGQDILVSEAYIAASFDPHVRAYHFGVRGAEDDEAI